MRKKERHGRESSAKRGGEDCLVRRIERSFRALRTPWLTVGTGDDAAIWRPRAGWETVVTCDWFLEGVHFLRDKHPPDAVGWKCLARAVSDVAAMGGEPRCFLLGLALPPTLTGLWLDKFLSGLRRASRRFGCALAGGDTTRYEEVLINVTVLGETKQGRAILRSGAQPGDVLFVSGQLGEAEAGLRLLRTAQGPAKPRDPRLRKHLYPEPRLELGQWLVERRLASGMMDVSDGLSTDLTRLCAASGTGARIEAARLPTPHAVPLPQGASGLKLALHGGDDYELLFAVPRRHAKRIPAAYRGLPLTRIGEITEAREIILVGASGAARPLRPEGWDPFAGRMR